MNRNVSGSGYVDPRIGSPRFLDHCQGEIIGMLHSDRAADD